MLSCRTRVHASIPGGLKACYVGAGASPTPSEEDAVTWEMFSLCLSTYMGDVQLVFINPESILSDSAWRDMLRAPVYQCNLVALAIDEAHLVEKW